MSAARDVALALAGRRAQRLANGSYLVPCPVPSHGKGRGDRNPSLRIGDGASRLLVHCYAGCNARDVLGVLRWRGLLDDLEQRECDRRAVEAQSNERRPREGDDLVRIKRAREIWHAARDPRRTLAENYLCLRRLALDDALAGRVLRFHPRTPWRSENSGEIEYLPALIAAFRSLDDDEITGIHRIALKPDGHKLGKRMLGVVHRPAVKDALAGVIYPITDMYDVPLMVARGYASLSFLYSAAEYINDLDVPAYIYHLGDFDPSGVNAGEKIKETLREMAPDADITFERIAVTPEQIARRSLPTRPTKASDSRSTGFGNISVELDAIDPNALRALVQETIEQHLPPHQFAVLKAAEQSEREAITSLVGKVTS